ncbi:MAG TPA: LacI family DNA-binding transcriptional regulator [Anaerolineae bacterium]|nr:LacI family DNA-binding transcriptional regulator [Anaerolineae bacterium]
MVTIKDVAKRAKVSPGTVSNALTKKRPVSKETQQRIHNAIKELGYQPNMLAQSLVARRSQTLAVVASGLEYYGTSRIIVGIEKAANELGYTLLLTLIADPSEINLSRALEPLTARRVDGIVWAVPEIGGNHSWITRKRLAALPPIVFHRMKPRAGLQVVAIDNRTGAMLATQHLINQGRRTIGLITGPKNWWETRERRAGWEQAFERAGLVASASLIVEGDWTAASGEHAITRLLAQRRDLDAVFASNDQMALGAMRMAQLLGRKIPQDLAIVGFDNIPESAFFSPPLTTVYQQLIEAGVASVNALHRMIEARHDGHANMKPRATFLMPELIVRESSTPPPR